MAWDIIKLDSALLTTGLPIVGVSIGANQNKVPTVPGGYTTFTASDGTVIGVDWSGPPTALQNQQVAQIIAKYNLLADIQQSAVASLINRANAWVAQSCQPNTRILLNSLYSQAVYQRLPNRVAYLDPLVQWGNAVAVALETAIEQVTAATTPDAVIGVALTLPDPPNPLPTRAGAMAIAN